MHLTLSLGIAASKSLPDWVRSRIDGNLTANAERWRRTKVAFKEIALAFAERQIEFLALKGFTHYPRFAADPRNRTQGDLDLLVTEDQVTRAFEAARSLDYVPIQESVPRPIDHLPMMVRQTGWRWRGDFYDVDNPVSLELHFRLWDSGTEMFDPPGLDEFWSRRERRQIEGLGFTAFHPADELAYAVLHLLRHLLRGDLRPSHVYELAWHLDHSSSDETFWRTWRNLHHPFLRQLEAIGFGLACRWFDCRVSGVVQEEIDALPDELHRWLDLFAFSPVISRFHPNKDEVWLHWSLLHSAHARMTVLRRRILPEILPHTAVAVHVPEARRTTGARLAGRWQNLVFLARRLTHHVRALPSFVWSAAKWFVPAASLGAEYWRFFFAEAFFDFGMFVFVFLYNLYLLKLGFREDFLGLVAGAMTAGNIAGSILAAVAIQRLGMRRCLLFCFSATALIAAARAWLTVPWALIALSAIAGVITAAWPVAYSPAITQLTTQKNRPFAFSFTSSAGISIGILGSLAAGRLPSWIERSQIVHSAVESYRLSLFAGCAFILLALLPLSRVDFSKAMPAERKLHRPSPMLLRFLIAMAMWNLGTGALNPFFNVFFAERVRLPVRQIGSVFSAAQIAQVAAILASPLVLRRFGLTRGISGMQMATGVALALLSISGGPVWAAAGYCAYMMSQYMSEPGQFTMLMELVRPQERNSATALNFLVTFAGQAIAAAAAGWLLARFGYPPVMVGAALVCLLAAIAFRALLSNPQPDPPSSG